MSKKDWEVSASKAAQAGLHQTSVVRAMIETLSPIALDLPGGTMRGKMGLEVAPQTWRSSLSPNMLVDSPSPAFQSCRDLFTTMALQSPHSPCMGSRPILSVRRDPVSGEPKYKLGNFQWLSYREAHSLATQFGRGLRLLGVNPGMKLNFFADTSAEWQLGFQACMQQGIVPTTTYANLGPEAVKFAIEQAEVETVFTDAHLVLEVLPTVLEQACPLVKRVIYIPSRESESFALPATLRHGSIQVLSFQDVCAMGGEEELEPPVLIREDLALIMYTSGSTAKPKGVLVTHGNLLAVVAGASGAVPNFGTQDTFLCYLPCAHILELVVELCCLSKGVALGYGTAKTMSSASARVDECEGDAALLRPTLMAAVPMIFDRIRAALLARVGKLGGVKAILFHLALTRKMHLVQRGKSASGWDLVVFDKLRKQLLGGRVRFMLCGGGPLSRQTQLFMNTVFCCPVGQGYGCTETTGVMTTCWPNDRLAFARVGAPIVCNQLRLVDWPEGGYCVADLPLPRGEILVSGPNVTQGYFQLPDKTAECYVTDAQGTRWFRTEDIGQMWPNGTLQIIDRKKDLVKLSGGEYVSYGKLEPLARESELVENCFFYANPLHEHCVLVVTPKHLQHPPTEEQVLQDVHRRMAESNVCVKFEFPKRCLVVAEAWTPESDLVTAALKLKRANLERKYARELEELYATPPPVLSRI